MFTTNESINYTQELKHKVMIYQAQSASNNTDIEASKPSDESSTSKNNKRKKSQGLDENSMFSASAKNRNLWEK